MSETGTGGTILTTSDINDVATRIADLWDMYNTERRVALEMNAEVRQYVFATDIDSTSSVIMPHKNRTHQPKLTELSDNLQSHYFEAAFNDEDFFDFKSENDEDENAAKMQAWVRTKLEARKFRQTVGRELIADYVIFGNCFPQVDYIVERDSAGRAVYRGPEITRVSPMDLVFNPRAASFQESPKIFRSFVHVAKVRDYPSKYPGAGFDAGMIDKAMSCRTHQFMDDWVEILKDRGIHYDGYGSLKDYFSQDMCEILVYRGDVFDPVTGTGQTNRVVYVMDRTWVIRNEPSRSPAGYDGLHHAGWRKRPDNLWAMGPLDNLAGLQYRINHLENLKADVFDRIANPTVVIKGEDVTEPEEGDAPGASYYVGAEGDVSYLHPDATALNADNQIQTYHRMMELFVGAPTESRGVRSPGEKTAFEVDTLDNNASKMFLDKVRNFELMLENMLKECFELLLLNFENEDYALIFDDMEGKMSLQRLSQADIQAHGEFVAMGSRHWERRKRMIAEMANYLQGPFQDPKIRMHTSGERLALAMEKVLNWDDKSIIEPFIGVKEDVRAQAIAAAEQANLQNATGNSANPVNANPDDTEQVQQGPENPSGSAVPATSQPGTA